MRQRYAAPAPVVEYTSLVSAATFVVPALAVSVEYVVAPAWTQYLRQWWSIPHHRQLWVTQFRSCSLCCASSRNGVHLSIVCGERSSWRQLRSRVVVSGVLARCLSASATQQGKFEESSVMEHFLGAPAATAVAAAETLRRHTLRLLLRQQGRCGVTLSDCCCGSRDVAASHSQTAVASAGTLPVVVTSHQLLRRSQRRACDEAPQIRGGGARHRLRFPRKPSGFRICRGGARIRLCFSGVAACDV